MSVPAAKHTAPTRSISAITVMQAFVELMIAIFCAAIPISAFHFAALVCAVIAGINIRSMIDDFWPALGEDSKL